MTLPAKFVVLNVDESVIAVFTVPEMVWLDGDNDDVIATTALCPAVPLPAKLIARTCTRYEVPLLSPVNSNEFTSPCDVQAPYVVPPLLETLVWKSVMFPPEPTGGDVHDTEMASWEAVAVTVGAGSGLGPSTSMTGRTFQ